MKKLRYCLAATAVFAYGAAAACTNFIVTKGASTDGSAMVSYAADSHALYGALYHTPGGSHKAGTMMPVYEWDTGRYLTDIPQLRETYSTVGNMNEHSLIIGETTYGGRPELDRTDRLRFADLHHAPACEDGPRGHRHDRRAGQHLRLCVERRIVLDRRPRRSVDHGADRQGIQG